MEKENKKEEVETISISVKDVFFIIRKHIIAILAFIVIGAACGFVYNKMQPTEYKAKATLLASISKNEGSTSTSPSSSDYALADYLSETYVELITQDVIINRAATTLNENYGENFTSAAIIKSGLNASASSLIINVSFTKKGYGTSQKIDGVVYRYHALIVNQIIDTVVEFADETITKEVVEGGVITTKDVAKYPLLYNNLQGVTKAQGASVVSHTSKRIIIGAVIGLVIAAIYTALRELLDNRFKSNEELERWLQLPVLSSIPEYTLEDFPKENEDK